MSRNRRKNDILTVKNKVKVGERVVEDGEPKALVGPVSNKDTFSLQEMAVALYGPGTRCIVYPAEKAANF